MAGASKRRLKDQRRGGAADATSRSSDGEPRSTQPSQSVDLQHSEQSASAAGPQPPVIGSKPFGYDGAGSTPGGSQQGGPARQGPSASSNLPAHLSDARLEPRPAFKHTDINRNLDLPPSAYQLDNQYEFITDFPKRPKVLNTSGKELSVKINSWPITKYPEKPVYQYDVLIGSGTEKRALLKKVWNSQFLKQLLGGPSWIFDGNRIAWSQMDKGSVTTTVDLDAEQGITPREGHENKHRVVIRKTNKIDMSAISNFLSGKMSFDSTVLEAINFLDHLLREDPSNRLTSIKQSFFARGKTHHPLAPHVEAFKGVYQTIRMCHGGRLGINVDVSNGVFWGDQKLSIVMAGITGIRANMSLVMDSFVRVPENINDPRSALKMSPMFKELRRLRKVAVKYMHRDFPEKIFIIERFYEQNAKEFTFKVRDKETGEVTETSMFDYFMKKYSIRLLHWGLPVMQTTKKNVVLPAELCWVADNQRYPYKLNPDQTATMIKFAVTKPKERLEDIEYGLGQLAWDKDPFLKGYGMGIASQMLETKARLLPPPQIQFGSDKANPGTGGRWDMKGRKFLLGNPVPLKHWGICIYTDPSKLPNAKTVPKPVVENFLREFIKAYVGHGGRVENRDPPILTGVTDAAKGVNDLFQLIGNTYKERPQIMIFILPDRTPFHYLRVKKSADCRFGVVSQCMQANQIYKCHGQYISNVLMKLNAKLGGTTSRIANKNPTWGHFTAPSMIIGADVTHAAPGSEQPSMAAITVSWDKYASRYIAGCETNGNRVEMITRYNIEHLLKPMVKDWIKMNNGNFPTHVYYFRDGVSEGQFQHVLNQELRDMRIAFGNHFPDWKPKFIVVVASKRHHVRFFPKQGQGDTNGNPLPGTLVERDVTHPFDHDFYLCSHRAIQGTARPVHYHVLLDEAGLSCNQLHGMIYDHCYQYIRSTTPVSLHPAVYYAHLASNRARPHENIPASSGPHVGGGPVGAAAEHIVKKKREGATSTQPKLVEPLPLLPMPQNTNIHHAMWYV
ncbi:MAG: Histone chaperone asf1 [Chaenotheca gracillima]|nr:MAG: Histone chaperone asf1 [Chaenotheca gracillima]